MTYYNYDIYYGENILTLHNMDTDFLIHSRTPKTGSINDGLKDLQVKYD